MLEIKKYPHPILSYVALPIKKVDQQLKDWIKETEQLMYNNGGIGLAATQVNLPYQFFVTSYSELPHIINPVLQSYGKTIEEYEGCLSLPKIHVKVKRKNRVKITGYDINGNYIDLVLKDSLARISLHEKDHLSGISILNKNSPVESEDENALKDLLKNVNIEENWAEKMETLINERCY